MLPAVRGYGVASWKVRTAPRHAFWFVDGRLTNVAVMLPTLAPLTETVALNATFGAVNAPGSVVESQPVLSDVKPASRITLTNPGQFVRQDALIGNVTVPPGTRALVEPPAYVNEVPPPRLSETVDAVVET